MPRLEANQVGTIDLLLTFRSFWGGVFLSKRKLINAVVYCVVLPMCLLSGCFKPIREGETGSISGEISVASIYPVTEATTWSPSLKYGGNAPNVIRGINDFTFRLSTLLAEELGDDNLICSPILVWMPLAALINASESEHREIFKDALFVSGISDEDINFTSKIILSDLKNLRDISNGHKALRMVSTVFVRSDLNPNKDFAQLFSDYYNGNILCVDFTSPEAVKSVNQWASENTNGLISDIVQRFSPDIVVAVGNAIYFEDRWKLEFDPRQTTENVFYSRSGEESAFFMLREGNEQAYYEDDAVQSVLLEYKSGGGMYIILPKDGDTARLLSSMSTDYFETIRTSMEPKTGKLLLPRFSMDSGIMQLDSILKSLDIPLFDSSAAPLMGGLVEGDVPIWLSCAMQKAIVKVDETGTVAATVTLIPGSGEGPAIQTEPFEMICNKPFLFVLFAQTSADESIILFTGIVNHPESKTW